MTGHQVKRVALESALSKEPVRRIFLVFVASVEVIVIEHIDDQVLDHDDVARVQPLADPLLLVLGEVGVDHIGGVVDDRPVFLFRHPPVVGAHASLDMHNRDVQLRR